MKNNVLYYALCLLIIPTLVHSMEIEEEPAGGRIPVSSLVHLNNKNVRDVDPFPSAVCAEQWDRVERDIEQTYGQERAQTRRLVSNMIAYNNLLTDEEYNNATVPVAFAHVDDYIRESNLLVLDHGDDMVKGYRDDREDQLTVLYAFGKFVTTGNAHSLHKDISKIYMDKNNTLPKSPAELVKNFPWHLKKVTRSYRPFLSSIRTYTNLSENAQKQSEIEEEHKAKKQRLY